MKHTDILNAFTTDELLAALKARGLDVVELYGQLEQLTVYVEETEREKDAPWPNEYVDAEAALRDWENGNRRADMGRQTGVAVVVAACIDIAREARLTTRRVPTADDTASLAEGMTEAVEAYRMAVMVCAGGQRTVQLRAFQKTGVSSRVIAHAIRFGFIGVSLPSDG